MAELKLVVGPYLGKEVRTVCVEDTMRVDQFVPLVVNALKLPLTDIFGLPLCYRLRTVGRWDFFSDGLALRDAGIRNGMKLVVADIEGYEREEAIGTVSMELPSEASRPLAKPVLPSPPQPLSDKAFRRTRRTVLLLMGLLVAGAGLGGGVFVAEAQKTTNPLAFSTATTAVSHVLNAPQIVTTFRTHQGNVRRALFSPDGAFLCSGGDDARIFIWKPDGTIVQRIATGDIVRALDWSPDGTQLAAGIGKGIAFFDAHSAILLSSQAPHSGLVTDLAWTQSSPSLVVSTGLDTVAFVWSSETHLPVRAFRMHTTSIEAVAVSEDTAATASLGGVVRVWNMQDTQEVHGYFFDQPQPLSSVAFSQSGVVAVGGNDGIVRLWNGLTCQRMGQDEFGERCLDTPLLLREGARPLHALRFSNDGRLLAFSNRDGAVTIWSMQQRTALFTLPLHGGIRSLDWSPTNQLLAVAEGQQVTIWRIP